MTKSIKILLQIVLGGFIASSCQNNISLKWDNYQAIEKAFKWQKDKKTKDTHEDWINASFYTGLNRVHALTQDEDYLEELIKRGEESKWHKHYNTDSTDMSLCSSYLYLDHIGIKDVAILPTAQIINSQLCSLQQSTSKDSIQIWHPKDLYIAAPLMVAYAQKVNDSYFIDQMHKTYKRCYNHLYSEEHRLFHHSLVPPQTYGQQKQFLLKENGMILAGLALILEKMPHDYIHRNFYEEIFKNTTINIIDHQQKNGLWSSGILQESTPKTEDLSGSNLCTFAIAWGINNQLLDAEEYSGCVQKAWSSARQHQNMDGKVGCEKANQNCILEATSTFILAGSEVLKLNENTLLANK